MTNDVRKIEVKRFDGEETSTKILNGGELATFRKVRVNRIPEFTDYLDNYLSMAVTTKTMIQCDKDYGLVYNTVANGYDVKTFIKYYVNTTDYKMKYLGIFVISNLIVSNLLFILEYFMSKGVEIVDGYLYDELLAYYTMRCPVEELERYKQADLVMKNYSIIHIDTDIEPRPKFKGSNVLVNIGKDFYKSIPYKFYKRLFKIEEFKIIYNVEELDESITWEEFKLVKQVRKVFNSPREIIAFLLRMQMQIDFIANDVQPALPFFDISIVKIEVKLNTGKTQYYRDLAQFRNEYFPGGI